MRDDPAIDIPDDHQMTVVARAAPLIIRCIIKKLGFRTPAGEAVVVFLGQNKFDFFPMQHNPRLTADFLSYGKIFERQREAVGIVFCGFLMYVHREAVHYG